MSAGNFGSRSGWQTTNLPKKHLLPICGSASSISTRPGFDQAAFSIISRVLELLVLEQAADEFRSRIFLFLRTRIGIRGKQHARLDVDELRRDNEKFRRQIDIHSSMRWRNARYCSVTLAMGIS